MAYTHSKYEIEMNALTPSTAPAAGGYGVALDVTGNIAEWAPGIVPHLIRGMAVVHTNSATRDTAISAKFMKSAVAGSAAATDFTSIGKVVLTTTVTALGFAFYFVPTAHIEIVPGQSVQLHVTAAATAGGDGKAILYVEPRWDVPGNLTSMVATTGTVTE
jgi:hypothetical protein|tara:strand:+ start:5501 stop:5983 length:483 start_codon:yes stop_codon:yes gene_type:complete